MDTGDGSLPYPGLGRLFLLMGIASVVALAWLGLQMAPSAIAQGQNQDAVPDEEHASVLSNQARFTGPGEVWPPQPVGAIDMVDGDLPAAETASERLAEVELRVQAAQANAANGAEPAAAGPSQIFLNDAGVAEALGDDYRLVGFENRDGSGKGRSGAALVYFSRSNNATVRGIVANGRVNDLEILPADTYQPALLSSEEVEAVELARQHWRAAGDNRIDSLAGFGILAFQPDGEYFDTRMVYVSFHVDEDARPELLAWVDLSRGEIVDAEVER